jgi:exopolyphosphatase/guanosine-5'-triphosphate,3'-diphosphate pyrophosphatase
LAAILRLAGGFDRSHTRPVQSVLVCPNPQQTEMRVLSDENPEVDLWGARRRAAFFEQVFQTRLLIDWQPSNCHQQL